MAENQTQPNPQFIFWVKKSGVFRLAEPKMPKNCIAYDLEKNVQLGTQDISLDTLSLVNSIYLGPITIFEEQMGHSMSNETFEILRLHEHGIAYGIIKLAEEVAKGQGVPYFAVNVVQTNKGRTGEFTEKEKEFHRKLMDDKQYPFIKKIDLQKEPLEFVLHPTAQLYMPRK